MLRPKSYEKTKGCAIRDTAIFVPKLINLMNWKLNENILDYGCGPGGTGFKYILPHVEKTDSTLYSVDSSDIMISHAKQHNSHSRINYALGNVLDKFPFGNVKFDKIFSILVFHFIGDIKSALSGLANILKPGGEMGFVMYSAKGYYFDTYRQIAEMDPWKEYLKGYNKYLADWSKNNNTYQFIVDLHREAGLQIKHLEIKNLNFTYQLDSLQELFLALNPFINEIPTDLHCQYKSDVRKILTQSHKIPFDSEYISVSYEYILGVAHRPNGNQLV